MVIRFKFHQELQLSLPHSSSQWDQPCLLVSGATERDTPLYHLPTCASFFVRLHSCMCLPVLLDVHAKAQKAITPSAPQPCQPHPEAALS